MTVREWLAARRPPPPPVLHNRVLEILGSDADAPVERSTDLCLAAASRSLQRLIAERRFARDSALDLLAIDALTTSAFEQASRTVTTVEEMEGIARRGTRLFAELSTHG